jgi:uncharacterized membrane protein
MATPLPLAAHALTRLARDRAGNIGTLTALTSPLLLLSMALGVDYGFLTLQQRQLQAAADLAAIAAAADVADADQATARHFAANGLSYAVETSTGSLLPPLIDVTDLVSSGQTGTARVERGRYTPDPAIDPADRFQPGEVASDAVRVTLERRADLFVAGLFTGEPPTLAASGIAARQKHAAFSVGSRLASLNDGILNALLGQMLGTTLSLNVMDYRALVDADIEVRPFLSAVATKLDLTAASYEDVLAAEVTMPQLLSSMRALHGLSGSASSALRLIEQATSGSKLTLPLSRILKLDPKNALTIDTGGDWAMAMSAMEIVSAAATLANGDSQIALDLGAQLPGLAKASVRLAIGEPPVETPSSRLDAPGTAVRTAQTRLAVDLSVDGLSALAGLRIALPLYVEVAASEARLADITCHGAMPTNASVGIDTVPGVAEIAIGAVDPSVLSDFSDEARVKAARLVDSNLLRVTGMAHVETKSLTPTRLTFSPSEIAEATMKSVSTRDILTSTTKTLLENLDLDVELLFLTLGTPKAVTKALSATLGAVTPAVDELLYNLLLVVGVRVGEADVRVTGVECRRPVLVQ